MTTGSKTSNAKRAARPRARRWLDLLGVYITNGLPRDRWHGQRYVRPSEGFAIWREALARLERINPELFKAVQELIDKEYEARQGLTYEEWKVAGHKSFVRISRLRRAIRRRRLEAQSGGQVY